MADNYIALDTVHRLGVLKVHKRWARSPIAEAIWCQGYVSVRAVPNSEGEEASYARTPETLDSYAHHGVAHHGTHDSPGSGVV
jgi:hypothetical protein